MANQQATGYDERYKFTGKERDAESGYDYFGARFYWSLFKHWTSPDPLLDKYLYISPYAYCNWNPVKFVDPDGQWVHIAVGAAIGATINGAYALSSEKSWPEVGAAALGGAVAGGIVAATGGLGSGALASAGLGIVGGATGGALGNITEQGVNVALGNQLEFDSKEIKNSALVGAIFEGIGGAFSGVVDKVASKVLSKSAAAMESPTVQKTIRNEIKCEYKNMGSKISNRQLDKLVKERINNIKDFDTHMINGTQNTIKYGVNPVITNCVENEIK